MIGGVQKHVLEALLLLHRLRCVHLLIHPKPSNRLRNTGESARKNALS
jgi:hypothetical protein